MYVLNPMALGCFGVYLVNEQMKHISPIVYHNCTQTHSELMILIANSF